MDSSFKILVLPIMNQITKGPMEKILGSSGGSAHPHPPADAAGFGVEASTSLLLRREVEAPARGGDQRTVGVQADTLGSLLRILVLSIEGSKEL